MPSKNLDPTKTLSEVSVVFGRKLEVKCQCNKSSLGKLHLCCFFDLVHGRAAASVHPLTPTISTLRFHDTKDTEAARPVGRSCLPHSRSTEHQSCVDAKKERTMLQCLHVDVVIPPHSPEVDPKDPHQSLRRASSFAPQRPLELCHRPLARSHRPWEAKALKIHHTPMHKTKQLERI